MKVVRFSSRGESDQSCYLLNSKKLMWGIWFANFCFSPMTFNFFAVVGCGILCAGACASVCEGVWLCECVLVGACMGELIQVCVCVCVRLVYVFAWDRKIVESVLLGWFGLHLKHLGGQCAVNKDFLKTFCSHSFLQTQLLSILRYLYSILVTKTYGTLLLLI